jgi:CheY-like chemotaxis protein
MALDRFSSTPSSSPQARNPFEFHRTTEAAAAPGADTDSHASYAEGEEGATQRRVLVVESDIESADLIIALLENEGFKVEVATDGQYGLMLADTFEPHLILLALTLPGMSGYEVTQVLRNEPRYSQRFRFTRIYYLTSKDHMLQKRFSSLPGTPMSDYIFKPIDIPELLDKVSRAFTERPGPTHEA